METLNAVDLEPEIQFTPGGVYSKVLARSKVFSCTLMCMAAGTHMDEHTSPRAGVVHILQGTGDFVLEGETIRMRPGLLIKMKPDAPHALTAEENVAFVLYLYD